jgi:predicted HD superfamily hydrolase involved in NAD metabolism
MQSLPSRSRILDWLADNVPAKRIEHILGVETMAVDLAGSHGIDPQIAGRVALMHDLAKYFKPQRLVEMARAENFPLDDIFLAAPHLLHAEMGAVVARTEFGIEDPAILSAIADHTLGRPNMSSLSCIIFLADTLESGRGDTPELQELRSTCGRNLYEAVWRTSDYSLAYLIRTRCLIHPRTILTRNWALTASREN